MKLIKMDKFINAGKGVNEDYDMVRVTIDMPMFQWNILRGQWALPYKPTPTAEPPPTPKAQDATGS